MGKGSSKAGAHSGLKLAVDVRNGTAGIRDLNEDEKRAVESVRGVVQRAYDGTEDIDHFYEWLADEYPYTMPDDEGAKVVYNRGGKIVVVGVDAFENTRTGKFQVSLTPRTYGYDEFDRDELEHMGVYE